MLMELLCSFTDVLRVKNNWGHPMHTFPAEAEQGDPLSSYFSTHAVNKCPFLRLFSVISFTCFGGGVGNFTV